MTGQRALTLLECVFAAFLFSTVMVLSFGVWPTYARAADQNRTRIGALFMARQEMEYAMSQGYAAVAPRSRTINLTATVGGHTIVTPYLVELQTTTLSPDLKSLHVRVSWTQYKRLNETTCDSLLAR